MIRQLVVLAFWLLLVLANNGEGRLVPNSMFDLQNASSLGSVSTTLQLSIPISVPLERHRIDPPQDYFLQTKETTDLKSTTDHVSDVKVVAAQLPSSETSVGAGTDGMSSIQVHYEVPAAPETECIWRCRLRLSYSCECIPAYKGQLGL